MSFRLLTLVFCISPFILFAQAGPKKAIKKLGSNPIYIIDSVRVSKQDMMDYDAKQVTLVHVLTDSDAINGYGQEALDGVVLIESKKFATKRYIRFLRKVSAQYDSVYKATNTDTTFQYIVNDKIQKGDFAGNLALIDDDNFLALTLLTAEELKRGYGINDKLIGILIKARRPDNLFNGEKKF
jgi:hypothetical protein